MPEPREARSIIENAEQAAAAGNYASAEDLLREAAALQEQTLGPHHPDLANTLNNLGVVCEMSGQSDRRGALLPPGVHHRDRDAGAGPSVRRHESQEPSRFLRGPRTAGGVAAVTTGGRSLAGSARATCSATARVVAVGEEAGRDADPSEEIPAPARTWRVERGCPADRDSHDGPALGQWGRGDQVASGDRDSSSARDSGPEANASAGRTDRATATDREAAAHSKRGRRGQRQAKHAHKIGRDANGGHGAALHRPQGVAMRGCGQPGSARADVLLHAGQIRNRHHD